jgi:hypothetical protein
VVYSVIPHKCTEPPSGPNITAADGTPIPCWGWQSVTITAGGRIFRWRFLKAAVAFALIGSDFLSHFDLKVDLRRLQLIGGDGRVVKLQEPPRAGVFALYGVRPALAVAPPPSSSGPVSQLCSPTSALPRSPTPAPAPPSPAVMAAVAPKYLQLVSQFPGVVNESKVLPHVTHNVEHFIETTGRPVASKYRRLDPDRLAAAKASLLSSSGK